MPQIDHQGRTTNYLRLSVTDRCNQRCSYCMPPQGVANIDHGSILYESTGSPVVPFPSVLKNLYHRR
ncbi:MAG: hypothetical protein WCD00_15375 [Desulfuromonadaceae bacterium]